MLHHYICFFYGPSYLNNAQDLAFIADAPDTQRSDKTGAEATERILYNEPAASRIVCCTLVASTGPLKHTDCNWGSLLHGDERGVWLDVSSTKTRTGGWW